MSKSVSDALDALLDAVEPEKQYFHQYSCARPNGQRVIVKLAWPEQARKAGWLEEEESPASRGAILDAARDAVTRDRAATHGAVESSFAHLAAVWSIRLGVTVTPAQVALMLVDLKVTRAWGNPGHADNWVDIAGYAACGGEIAGGGA